MDMARKFIQMGMTRSKRYANHTGGRKYVDGKEKGNSIEKSTGHNGKEEKEEASRIFREVWERCKSHEGYLELKKEFLKEQKEWSSTEGEVKPEVVQTMEGLGKKRRKSGRIKLGEEQEALDLPKAAPKRIKLERD
jgi:hypothetical protein